ncbi:NUDIX hydrolase [Psychrobacillus sp. INOP01]|uniref:NUDIX hydrolase n=1 Tax=Psychrobacillus sp. INOP01 TaxID=2829187 RepID=UPI001BA65E8A|nr:NUDIX hydrolase [Psychrobacillus sp. INOP01]QUG42778.1 NUDIX hydrolase [Psychrobacillus sp. INOP01]
MERWKMLHSEYVHKSPYGNIRKDTCELPNGIVIDDYYVNEYSNWVNAVVLTKENQMVLVEQYRHAGNDIYLEIPAGKKENNETDEEGIIREIREETGFVSQMKPILLGEFMINPATQNNNIKTYLILDAFKQYEQDLDETEEINIRLIDFELFSSMLKRNDIKTQLFTASAYYMARNFLVENIYKCN